MRERGGEDERKVVRVERKRRKRKQEVTKQDDEAEQDALPAVKHPRQSLIHCDFLLCFRIYILRREDRRLMYLLGYLHGGQRQLQQVRSCQLPGKHVRSVPQNLLVDT